MVPAAAPTEPSRPPRILPSATRTSSTSTGWGPRVTRSGRSFARSSSTGSRQGVRVFRVDNPHTKPLPFWEWVIGEVHARHPDAIFLAEAFTRPKMMKALAKSGFNQSYTYFTWRNFKHELEDYLAELTQGPTADFMIGNFWPNTPDILPEHLQQEAGRHSCCGPPRLA